MSFRAKAGIVTAIGALAVTGPAVAEACTQGHQGQKGQGKGQQGVQFRGDRGQFARFGGRGHRFGQSEFGTLVSWSATQTGTNTYSGSITVSKPAFTAHWARQGSSAQPTQSTQPTQTTQVTYTFTNAKVFFGPGANPPAAGDLVKVVGFRLGHCKSSGNSSGTSTSTSSGTTTTSTGNVRAIFIAAPRTSSSTSSS
jgi:hypothetical protein